MTQIFEFKSAKSASSADASDCLEPGSAQELSQYPIPRLFAKIPAWAANRWATMLSTRSARPTAIKAAVVAQLVCAGYLQLIEWVPVFPWNDLAHGNGQERLDVILAVVQLAIAFGFWMSSRVAMGLGLAAYAGWMYLQIDSWWRPYLFSGRIVGPRWYFARTYKFLPQIDHRPTPDAAHVVLQILLLAVLITGVVAIYRVVRRPRTTPSSAALPS